MTLLLILLNICHWIADYTWLSTPWMLNAKRKGTPLFPIFCHACVHATLMGAVLQFYLHGEWLRWRFDTVDALSFTQLFTHFSIDVLKGRMNVWFPKVSHPANVIHWTVFGADQLLHQLVIIFMAYYAAT